MGFAGLYGVLRVRDLLLADDEGKSRFLTAFKGRTGFGMS